MCISDFKCSGVERLRLRDFALIQAAQQGGYRRLNVSISAMSIMLSRPHLVDSHTVSSPWKDSDVQPEMCCLSGAAASLAANDAVPFVEVCRSLSNAVMLTDALWMLLTKIHEQTEQSLAATILMFFVSRHRPPGRSCSTQSVLCNFTSAPCRAHISISLYLVLQHQCSPACGQ